MDITLWNVCTLTETLNIKSTLEDLNLWEDWVKYSQNLDPSSDNIIKTLIDYLNSVLNDANLQDEYTLFCYFEDYVNKKTYFEDSGFE